MAAIYGFWNLARTIANESSTTLDKFAADVGYRLVSYIDNAVDVIRLSMAQINWTTIIQFIRPHLSLIFGYFLLEGMSFLYLPAIIYIALLWCIRRLLDNILEMGVATFGYSIEVVITPNANDIDQLLIIAMELFMDAVTLALFYICRSVIENLVFNLCERPIGLVIDGWHEIVYMVRLVLGRIETGAAEEADAAIQMDEDVRWNHEAQWNEDVEWDGDADWDHEEQWNDDDSDDVFVWDDDEEYYAQEVLRELEQEFGEPGLDSFVVRQFRNLVYVFDVFVVTVAQWDGWRRVLERRPWLVFRLG